MADIFLSYSREDRDRVTLLVERLVAQGWSVWRDSQILPEKVFDDVIASQLVTAHCVVVVWSAASVQSQWVRSVAGEAIGREVLVPVMLDEVALPFEFRRVPTAQLFEPGGPEWEESLQPVILAITALVRAGAERNKTASTASTVELPPPDAISEIRRSPATYPGLFVATALGALAIAGVAAWLRLDKGGATDRADRPNERASQHGSASDRETRDRQAESDAKTGLGHDENLADSTRGSPAARPEPTGSPILKIPDAPLATNKEELDKPFQVGGEVSRPKKISGENLRCTNTTTEPKGRLFLLVMQLTIDRRGEVVDAKATSSGSFGERCTAAERGIRKWKFEPAKLNGKPVPVTFPYIVAVYNY